MYRNRKLEVWMGIQNGSVSFLYSHVWTIEKNVSRVGFSSLFLNFEIKLRGLSNDIG